MRTKNSSYVRMISLLSGLAFLSVGIIGCQTSSRTHESDWSLGAGGSAVTSSEEPDPGYGPQVYVRKRVSDHFKLELQGTQTHHDVTFRNSSQEALEMDAVFSSLTAQYEFMPSESQDVRLFIGGGGAYGWFLNEDPNGDAGVREVDLENDEAGIAQVGLKVPWGFHLTASRLFEMKPETTVNGSTLEQKDLNIWIFSAGLNIPF